MQMSEHGRQLLTQWEGMKTSSYLDAGGKPTIGVGHLLTDSELSSGTLVINGVSVPWNSGINEFHVAELLRQDLGRFEDAVNRVVDPGVELAQSQFDALVSFAFNVGVAGFTGSTLLERVNTRNLGGVPTQLRRWTKLGDGQVSEGLANRRENEVDLWNFDTTSQPAPAVIVSPSTYTVEAGDTLESVALRFDTTIAALANTNNIINPADFTPGRVVNIPSPAPIPNSKIFAGELSKRDAAKNTSRHVLNRAKVMRQVVSPTLVAGVDHREQVQHIIAVQQFGRDLNIGINADGVAGPLTYGLTLSLQLGMIDGHYLDTPLHADAAPGPATTAMLGFSRDNGFRCSKNFRWSEFDTQNPDRVLSKSNPVLRIDRDLMILAQRIRDHVGFSFSPVSAYRDPEWNQVVGGSLASQHMLGKAIDIENERLRITESTARQLGAKGVGVVRATGFVAHVDTREVAAKWFY